MHVRLDRKSPLPLHLQLKTQLAHLMQAGEWPPGRQLPTVRQLAGRLRINRNTAARVFSELSREGYLSCERGRGTFVSRWDAGPRRRRARQLMLVLDVALAEARRLGFSQRAFAAALYARAHTAGAAVRLRKAAVLFVECDRPRLRRFGRELARSLPVRVDLGLVGELERTVRRDPRALAKYALVVTSALHVREVRRLLGPARAVVGLPAGARLGRMLRHVPLADRTGLDLLRRGLAAHARR